MKLKLKLRVLILFAFFFCSSALMSAELNAGKFSASGLLLLNSADNMTDANGKITANAVDVKYPFFMTDGEILNVHLLVKVDNVADAVAKLELLGCKIITHTKTVYAITAPVDVLGDISMLSCVSRIEPSKKIKFNLDESRKSINADTVKENKSITDNGILAGESVIVGIVDTGLDLNHPDLFDENGSRILYYWDMSQDDPNAYPEGYSYGKEYTKAQIDADSSDDVLAQTDPVGHGTHVCGTAAGSGTLNPDYRGIACKSDIIGVKVISSDETEEMTDENIIAACDYIIKKAKSLNKPVVINMSLGENFMSGNDGKDLSSIALNEAAGPGVIFSVSAGNEGAYPIHEGVDYVAGSQYSFPVLAMDLSDIIGSYDNSDYAYSGANIWYTPESLDSLVFSIYSYQWGEDGVSKVFSTSLPLDGRSINNKKLFGSNNTTYGFLSSNSVPKDALSGDANLMLYVNDGGQKNVQIDGQLWTITAYPKSAGRLDLWAGIALSQSILNQYPIYSAAFDDLENVVYCDGKQTLAYPGMADSSVCVGSFNTKTSIVNYHNKTYKADGEVLDGISYFSSIGPRRDGVMKPDILAPGSLIIAPMSSTISDDNLDDLDDYIQTGKKYIGMEGTSMSAPHVTGAIALLLQIDPTLSAYQVQQILHRTAKVDSYTGEVPNVRAGWGKLDVQAAVNEVLAGSGIDYVTIGDVKVYPLPAVSDVTVVLNDEAFGSEQLTLCDNSGNAVKVSFDVVGSKLRLNVSQLATGVYSGSFGGTKFKFIVK